MQSVDFPLEVSTVNRALHGLREVWETYLPLRPHMASFIPAGTESVNELTASSESGLGFIKSASSLLDLRHGERVVCNS